MKCKLVAMIKTDNTIFIYRIVLSKDRFTSTTKPLDPATVVTC